MRGVKGSGKVRSAAMTSVKANPAPTSIPETIVEEKTEPKAEEKVETPSNPSPNDLGIISGFDWKTLKRSKVRQYQTGNASIVAMLNEIDPRIEKLKEGDTILVPVNASLATKGAKDIARSFLMMIRGKLTSATLKGGEWEGREYATEMTPDKTGVYVGWTNTLAEPRARKVSTPKAKDEAKVDTKPEDIPAVITTL